MQFSDLTTLGLNFTTHILISRNCENIFSLSSANVQLNPLVENFPRRLRKVSSLTLKYRRILKIANMGKILMRHVNRYVCILNPQQLRNNCTKFHQCKGCTANIRQRVRVRQRRKEDPPILEQHPRDHPLRPYAKFSKKLTFRIL